MPAGKHIHRFVTAQFPRWIPATDLIQSAIGENPRRLKRYCNLLSYKYSVEHTSDEHLEEVDGVNR